MKEETIIKVAKVLEEWNPLGEKAKSVEYLNGYRVEAIDIIATFGFFYQNNVEKAILDIVGQAFNIKLNDAEVKLAAEKIKKIIDNGH